MNTSQAARRIVEEIIRSQFYKTFKRFDIVSPSIRVYGRVTTANGQQVVMIQNIRFDEKFQRKGLFTALVNEFKARFHLPVYVQCVGNKGWEDALRRSPHWHHVQGHDYISY